MEREDNSFGPDFYVVGAAKAGTTAIYHWLKDHPSVFLPEVKEPGYFAYAGGSGRPDNGPYDPEYAKQIAVDGSVYSQLYASAKGRRTGDVSPVYLLDENAAERIAKVRPDARIIIVLREPVGRAYSQFLHHLRDGLEPCASFEEALQAEDVRFSDGWSWGHGYARHGHYLSQVQRYLAVFPREQVLFLEFEMLRAEPEVCWRRMCDHLGIEHRDLARNENVNTTVDLAQVPGRPAITRLLKHPGSVQAFAKRLMPASLRKRLRKRLEGNGRSVPRLSPATQRNLAMAYAPDRVRLEEITGLSLDHWRQDSP